MKSIVLLSLEQFEKNKAAVAEENKITLNTIKSIKEYIIKYGSNNAITLSTEHAEKVGFSIAIYESEFLLNSLGLHVVKELHTITIRILES